MKKALKKIVIFLFDAAWIGACSLAILLVGCRSLTPTVVPPLTKELGFSVPNVKGITTMGMIDASYNYQVEKMKLWKYSVDYTLEATERGRQGVLDIMTMIGLGGTAALPVALRKLPKGAVMKDDKAA